MPRFRSIPTLAAAVLASAAALAGTAPLPVPVGAQSLETVPALASGGEALVVFDGVVEAVREAVVAAQVPGTIVALDVEAGDRVEAGKPLLRIDARIADREAAANEAQLRSARADLAAATRDLERQLRLHGDDYISGAALDRAESAFASARARVDALLATTRAARIHDGLHVVKAPFAGIVSDVPVAVGDMAMPGRALFSLHDPAAMRVAVVLPQTVATRLDEARALQVDLPGVWPGPVPVAPADVQVLPVVDAGTHTARLRVALPAGARAAPGVFARLGIVLAPPADGPFVAHAVTVPVAAIVRRAEMTGLYVVDGSGRALLRQVRLGRPVGDRVEVLTGLEAGERVAVDPRAAARRHGATP